MLDRAQSITLLGAGSLADQQFQTVRVLGLAKGDFDGLTPFKGVSLSTSAQGRNLTSAERAREFVGKRMRIWTHHRVQSVWYPTQRGYVFARELAQQLADTIEIAATVTQSNRPTPDWLTAWIDARARRVEWLEDLNAPDKLMAAARERFRQLLQNPCWPRLPTHSRL